MLAGNEHSPRTGREFVYYLGSLEATDLARIVLASRLCHNGIKCVAKVPVI